MRRIACIIVPDFPIAAIARANPDLRNAPLAISQSLAPHAQLSAISPRARKAGVRPSMTIAQARSVLSNLIVVSRSEAAERSAIDALTDVALCVSPLVEPGTDGRVWIDLAGLGRLYESEEALAREILRCVDRVEISMEAAVGVASNKEIAELAARCGGIRIIEAGQEREFLDWLPLDVLDLNGED